MQPDPRADLPNDGLAPGTPVGPYDLLTPVGTGGMAQVWAARARETGHVVALKMLLPELAENEEFRQMFYDEACIASLAAHPNVCAIHHLSQDQGTLYLAMEWVDGASLMRLLRPSGEEEGDSPKFPLPFRVAARIVADACAGLHAAHELRGSDGRLLEVVHRDASPHNVLVGRDGSVKVTDFGVAKAFGKLHMTLAGQIKGKLAYMSPEQLMGGELDRRTDVFALGAVLYEVTTGQRPFVGDHDPQVMAAIAMGQYLPASEVMPGYPRALAAIVDRALANELGERYRSAAELGRALEDWLSRSGPPVTRAEVAQLVYARCGQEIDDRARSLQEAMRMITSGRRSADASGPTSMPRSEPGEAQSVLWILAAALLGIGLGLGVLAYVSASRKPPAARHPAPETASAESAAPADPPLPLLVPPSLPIPMAAPPLTIDTPAVTIAAPAATPTEQARPHAEAGATGEPGTPPEAPPNPYD